MLHSEDILLEIPDGDIAKLRDIYKEHLPRTAHVYNFLNTTMKWKKKRPDKNYITLMAPQGKWNDGTFIALLQWSCYDLFMFTLEKSCERLYQGLSLTKKIDWNKRMVLYAIHEDHYPTLSKVLEEVNYPLDSSTRCNIWWIPKEKAAEFTIDCPPEVYVAKLEKRHAKIINPLWPPRFKGSEEYLATFIAMNGGFGVFLKNNDELVAWALKNHLGALGAIQVVDGHKMKGYGSLVTKALSKEIAEEGAHPLGTVGYKNASSQAMFRKLGFLKSDLVIFVEGPDY